MTALSDKKAWTRQIACPTAATQVRVLVPPTDDDFWPADMTLKIVRDNKGRPSLDPRTGFTQFHVTDLLANAANNDADWLMRLEVTVSQLQGLRGKVRGGKHIPQADPFKPQSTESAGANTTNFRYLGLRDGTAPGRSWRVPDSTAALLVKGQVASASADDAVSEASWSRIAHVLRSPDDPVGRMYFAQHKNKNDPHPDPGPSIHRRLAAQVRGVPQRARDAAPRFSPRVLPIRRSTRTGSGEKEDFWDLSRRYLFTEKTMVQQHFWTQRKVILVMPVGSDEAKDPMGSLNSWNALERLLREVLFFILRIEKAGPIRPRFQDIGRVAVSGFSWGINAVTPIVASAPAGSPLREVYDFDGIESHGRAPAFNKTLVAWAAGSASPSDPRMFRMYTQDPSPNAEGLAAQVGASRPSTIASTVEVQKGWDTTSKGANGNPRVKPATYSVTTREWEAKGRTVVSMPNVAWQGLVAPKKRWAFNSRRSS